MPVFSISAANLHVLPTDRPHPAIRSFQGARVSQPLDDDIFDGLKTLSKKNGATLFTTLLTGLGTLLARLTGQKKAREIWIPVRFTNALNGAPST